MDFVDSLNFIDDMDVEYMETFRESNIVRARINPFEQYDDVQLKKIQRQNNFTPRLTQRLGNYGINKQGVRTELTNQNLLPE
ncbi:unnamed protein product [Euphydryas editha]|uniref:Uncharacterized protein n=1 Tax=Euphydryas editha TaxID=104508 RepID=A0AAU9UMN0_EUPED|nr:unnamed protein product [Euphydryas editha]